MPFKDTGAVICVAKSVWKSFTSNLLTVLVTYLKKRARSDLHLVYLDY